MFVTSNWTYGTDLQGNRGFERLDNTVQNAARHGHGNLQPYANEFKALASCGSTDARTHTSTTYTSNNNGVPIYWVAGDKVADNYRDFYDGSWDSLDARSQTGWSWDRSGYAAPLTWTGTNSDGTSSRNHACSNTVTYGYADDYWPGKHFSSGVLDARYHRALYGLSSVFTVSTAPGAPGAPTVVSTTHDSVTIRWNTPASSGATSIFDYNVSIKRAGGSWQSSTPYHWGSDATHTLTGLSPNTEYQVRVLAKNHGADPSGSDIGYGPYSPVTTFSTQAVAPSAPGNLTVSPFDTTAVVRWNAPAWHGATPIHDYDVSIKRAGGSWTESNPAVHGTRTSTTLTGLSPNTEYHVHVRANNHGTDQSNAGSSTLRGAWSPVVVFHTIPSSVAVPDDWPLIPSGLGGGDSFRLLFVTSDARSLYPANLMSYNQYVQNAAGDGHDAIGQFRGDFRALVSSTQVTALANTSTQHSSDNQGVPIYYLNGDKVADDYGDFYDGCWDSNSPRDENGNSVQGKTWTGSDSDGTKSLFTIGSGRSGDSGNPTTHCSEIEDGSWGFNWDSYRVYGLSPVFQVMP